MKNLDLIAWNCLEIRKVIEEREGQIVKSDSLGFTWFKSGEEPELYVPDDEGIMFCIPPKPMQRPVFTNGEKPQLQGNNDYENRKHTEVPTGRDSSKIRPHNEGQGP